MKTENDIEIQSDTPKPPSILKKLLPEIIITSASLIVGGVTGGLGTYFSIEGGIASWPFFIPAALAVPCVLGGVLSGTIRACCHFREIREKNEDEKKHLLEFSAKTQNAIDNLHNIVTKAGQKENQKDEKKIEEKIEEKKRISLEKTDNYDPRFVGVTKKEMDPPTNLTIVVEEIKPSAIGFNKN